MLSIKTICICGAGTMGSGITQVAAQSGYTALLYDPDPRMLEKAKDTIEHNLMVLVEKNRLNIDQKNNIYNSIQFLHAVSDCVADVIIEAITENREAKTCLFNQLAAFNSIETIFATNTSSLSVTAIAENLEHPSRIAGMHFFNPAPAMKLVEVVKGEQTGDDTIQTLCALAKKFGKIPVICKDVPGFIVNRVARQYYLEALKLVETRIADIETIDAIMESTGFKMGPFKLMDLIGNDINLEVTRSLYEAYNRAARFKPSVIQEQKVKNGELGRKTGKGYYTYQ